MTTSELGFVPLQEFEKSPERIDELEGVETPNRVDLKELPLGSVIQFYGVHHDSKYITLLCGPESDRQIKIWLKGRGNGAIGSIDCLFSQDFLVRPRISQLGILEVGKNYCLPHFYFDKEDNVSVAQQFRTEPYTKIFLKRPDTLALVPGVSNY